MKLWERLLRFIVGRPRMAPDQLRIAELEWLNGYRAGEPLPPDFWRRPGVLSFENVEMLKQRFRAAAAESRAANNPAGVFVQAELRAEQAAGHASSRRRAGTMSCRNPLSDL